MKTIAETGPAILTVKMQFLKGDKGNMARWIGSILKGDGFTRQAKRAFDVQTQVQYCHPEYDFSACTICETHGQRPLIIASLKPKNGPLPSFSLRWDPRGNHLNVDIEEASPQVTKLFKEGKQGYRGHRPKMVAEKQFDVNVGMPSQDVFMGRISFKIHENVALDGKIHLSGECIAVLKKDGESRTIK
jgi:hypothetical protein